MKKNCELCKGAARVLCESDQARLCWSCDAKVHSANFLVARHVRSLLCHSCQSPTAWSGSGHKLGRTISVCEPCVKARVTNNTESHGANNEDSESGIDYDTDEDVNEQDELLEGNPEDGDDNQVVPLSSCSSESHRYRPDIDINISPEASDDYVAADLESKVYFYIINMVSHILIHLSVYMSFFFKHMHACTQTLFHTITDFN